MILARRFSWGAGGVGLWAILAPLGFARVRARSSPPFAWYVAFAIVFLGLGPSPVRSSAPVSPEVPRWFTNDDARN